ncbi:MAG: hypothetical protein IRD7MM_01850 [Candidatus Midichloria mitochondrii]|uniref:Uncharacterized protein n=1 Tax=Midichloria mitochondrii (strain IricVA) TaxID=696127 RepID=F7XW28_MIDMI|nr:DUF5394 family protein [Candidatus Midichloria mitochondrii]AEI88877.1 hypothetical protein midi_00577 [Candidatus Midichloria mitochondrii IricVA]MDJ1256548.1 DUF5394 family protein [Candidatus Midichloria mitochondrii]MDJ1288270.1 DUF5394 family protein [Candidatus Midichloria mitochondrii]MDJ1299149.1 DUF5394 family protein [Candidatus Midichloria mitochondrii]MDJ1313284.1 DUF5394 family protein [Candidatus Midichloria mitochondrii]
MSNENRNQASYAIKECYNIISDIVNKNKKVSEEDSGGLKMVLMRLLEHLITTKGNLELDKLIKIILALLKMKKNSMKKEEELSEEELKTQTRFVIYEIYKMLNPSRIAGETEIQNFIDNVMIRGVEAALYYDRRNISRGFSKEELKILGQRSKTALRRIDAFGSRGWGKGM